MRIYYNVHIHWTLELDPLRIGCRFISNDLEQINLESSERIALSNQLKKGNIRTAYYFKASMLDEWEVHTPHIYDNSLSPLPIIGNMVAYTWY